MADQEKDDKLFHDHFDGNELKKLEKNVDKIVEKRDDLEEETADSDAVEAAIIMEGETEPGESPDEVEDSEESADEEESAEADEPTLQPNKYQMAIGGLVVAVCVSLVAYGVGRLVIGGEEIRQKLISPEVYRASVGETMADVIRFARFVVPFPDEDERTYMLLTVSVKPSSRSVHQEIDEKKILCRGAIYSRLLKVLKIGKKEVISGKEMKQHILNALEAMLVNGIIDDVYFGEFLVV